MRSLTIEVAGDDVGIVVAEGRGFRFFGSDPRIASIEGRFCRDPAEATRSASALIKGAVADRAVPSRVSPVTTSTERSFAQESLERGVGRIAGHPGVTTEFVRSEEGLRRLLPDWWGLWQRAERATPFQSPGWLAPWWTSFRPGELFSVAVRRHGELIALAPLYLESGPHGRRLLPIGISVGDSLDVLIDPAWRDCARAIVLRALAEEGGAWDSLHLEDVPERGEALALELPDGYGATASPQNPHPVLVLDGGEPRPLRRVEKAWRRARRHGAVRVVPAGQGDAPGFVEELFRLHAAAWEARGEPGVLASDDIRSFHRAGIPLLHAAGIARLLRLEIAGRTAAILYGFVHRGRASAYLSGYDPAFAYESPGAILLDAFVRQAAREGVREFDFLRGRERYKYDWGATDRWTVKRVIAPLAVPHGRG